jgi:hypothetical protein
MADPRKLLKALLTSSTMHGRLDAEEKNLLSRESPTAENQLDANQVVVNSNWASY